MIDWFISLSRSWSLVGIRSSTLSFSLFCSFSALKSLSNLFFWFFSLTISSPCFLISASFLAFSSSNVLIFYFANSYDFSTLATLAFSCLESAPFWSTVAAFVVFAYEDISFEVSCMIFTLLTMFLSAWFIFLLSV